MTFAINCRHTLVSDVCLDSTVLMRIVTGLDTMILWACWCTLPNNCNYMWRQPGLTRTVPGEATQKKTCCCCN